MQLALPADSETLLQSAPLVSANDTVPDGLAPVTIAISVNGWFSTNVVSQAVESAVVVGDGLTKRELLHLRCRAIGAVCRLLIGIDHAAPGADK